MITFKVFYEDKLWHSDELFESPSIVEAWKVWWEVWNKPLDEYDEGLELALYVDDEYCETLYYEEWNVKEN